MKKTIAAITLSITSIFGSAALPPAEVHASATECTRYIEPKSKGRDWAYLYCNKGKSIYFAYFICVHWVGDTRLVDVPFTNAARPGTTASVGWCEDGFHVRYGPKRKVIRKVLCQVLCIVPG